MSKTRCEWCNREIGINVQAVAVPDAGYAIICGTCMGGSTLDIHAVLHAENCQVEWHDMWDHSLVKAPVSQLTQIAERKRIAGIMQGDELGATVFPSVPARSLITAGMCHPMCLLALDQDADCDCRCHGEFHGAMTDLTPDSNDETEDHGFEQVPPRPRTRSTVAGDIAIIGALDPPPATVREARVRLGWQNQRTVVAMRNWRACRVVLDT